MIEFLDGPAPRRLQNCPAKLPTDGQKRIIAACLELASRAQLLPAGLEFPLHCVDGVGHNGNHAAGQVQAFSTGEFTVAIDVNFEGAELARIVLHELGHVRFLLSPEHDDYRFHRITDPREFQRVWDEDEAFARSVPERLLDDAVLQGVILAAQTGTPRPVPNRLNEFPGQWPTRAQTRISNAVVGLARHRGFFGGPAGAGIVLNVRTVAAPEPFKGLTARDELGALACWVNVAIPPDQFSAAIARECARLEFCLRHAITDPEHAGALQEESDRFAADFARRVSIDAAVDAAVRAARHPAGA